MSSEAVIMSSKEAHVNMFSTFGVVTDVVALFNFDKHTRKVFFFSGGRNVGRHRNSLSTCLCPIDIHPSLPITEHLRRLYYNCGGGSGEDVRCHHAVVE